MYKTKLKDYSMYTPEQQKEVRKESLEKNKKIIDYINTEFQDVPKVLRLSSSRKVLLYRNFYEWESYICENPIYKENYNKIIESSKGKSSFWSLMELRDNILDNRVLAIGVKRMKSPETEEEYKELHEYLQHLFVQPFTYEEMIYIKRAITEGYTMTDIFNCHNDKNNNKKLFTKFMVDLPKMVEKIKIKKMKDEEK